MLSNYFAVVLQEGDIVSIAHQYCFLDYYTNPMCRQLQGQTVRYYHREVILQCMAETILR